MVKHVTGFYRPEESPEEQTGNERASRGLKDDKAVGMLAGYLEGHHPVSSRGSGTTTMSSAEICYALENVCPSLTVERVSKYMLDHGYRCVAGLDGEALWLMTDTWDDSL